MSLLEKLSNTLSETAKLMGQKSSEFVEISKIFLAGQKKQDEIQAKYEEIGQYVYSKLKRTHSVTREELYAWIKEIDILESDIEKLEKMALNIRNIRYCTYCNAEFDKGTKYCPFCGRYINI